MKFDCGMDDHCNIYTTSYLISFTLNMCVQYSMQKNCKRKEKEKKRKKETFSPELEVYMWQRLGSGLEPPLLPIGITNRD